MGGCKGLSFANQPPSGEHQLRHQADIEALPSRPLQSSNPDVYAVGDVAAFPLKLTGQVTRQEHVVNCRQTAAHAMRELLQPNSQDEYNYLPYFYSRVFNLSWQFYGVNTGRAVLFSDGKAGGKFGTFWVDNGKVVGAFLESGTPGAMLTHPHHAFCACMALCPGYSHA